MRRIVVDADVGVDDALALMTLLRADDLGEVHIEAIICTYGNTTVENVARNVVRLLEIAKRTDIPVYKGAKRPFLIPTQPLSYFHGTDGFADLNLTDEPDMSVVKTIPAAVAIRDVVTKYPEEVSVICLGPLTNLALALMLHADTARMVKDVWIMGGNYTAMGNTTAAAEFNFYVDPEAVHITLETLQCPVYLLPWESCVKSTITFDWRYNILSDDTPILHLLTRAEKKIFSKSSLEFYTPCDAFLSFCFLNPSGFITKQSSHHAMIELHGLHTRGQIVLDHLKKKRPNVILIEEFDQEKFKERLMDFKDNL